MRIVVGSIFGEDQDKALDFHTRVLGFQVRANVPMGGYRWLTVGNPGEGGGIELSLEPNAHPAVVPFQEGLVADGGPFTNFRGGGRPGGI